MLNKIKKIKNTVRAYLVRYESLRDSDSSLIASIWHLEAVKDNPSLTAKELLDAYARGELTNAEAIRRARQKIQENEPSLRGKNYQGRKVEEEAVRSGIKEV